MDTEKSSDMRVILGFMPWSSSWRAEDFPSLLLVNPGLITMWGYRCIFHVAVEWITWVFSTCPVWPVLTVRTPLPVPCGRYREGASSCTSVPSCLSLLRVPAFQRAHLCLADHVATSQRSLISRWNCFRTFSCV